MAATRRFNYDLPELAGFVEQRVGTLNVATAGTGSPLLLIHGLGATWRSWMPILPKLVDHHRVIAIDLPGAGDSDEFGSNPYALGNVAAIVRSTLDAMGIERCAIAGHSFGGGLATRMAALTPERVSALMLLAPAGFYQWRVMPPLPKRNRPLYWWSRQWSKVGGNMLTRSQLLRSTFFARVMHDPSRVLPEALIMLAAESTRGGHFTSPAAVEIVSTSLLPDLPKLTMPTLLMWGARDRVVTNRPFQLVAGSLPDCRGAHLLENCGHLLMWDDPEQVSQLMLELVDSVESAANSG